MDVLAEIKLSLLQAQGKAVQTRVRKVAKFKEDENEDSFLTSLSSYLKKKVFQAKGSDKNSTKRRILLCATFKFRISLESRGSALLHLSVRAL